MSVNSLVITCFCINKLSAKFKLQGRIIRNAFDIGQLSNAQLSNFVPLFRNCEEKSKDFRRLSSKMSTPTTERSSCVFCNIVNKLENTEIIYEDEQVCVFRDIKPASDFHILTVPKRHIEDVKSLTVADKDLVQHMLKVAKELLPKHNLSVEDARFGYHWPPFRSVKHLHLHTIAPESQMGYIGRLVFKKNSYWFVGPEYVESLLC